MPETAETPDLPTTIPGILDRAAEKFGDRGGARRRRPPALLDRAGRGDRPGRRRADRHRHRARRPGGDLGATTSPSGSSRPRARTGAARSSCRSTPGSRATKRPTSCAPRAPASCSPSPTSSTPTTSTLIRSAGDVPALEEIVVLRGPDGTRHHAVGRVHRPRRRRRCRRRAGPLRRGAARRPVRHPLHVGHHRRAQGRDAAPRRERARVRHVVQRGRPARGRPLPDHQPVLPRVRPEGGHPRQPDQGRDDHPAPGVRRRRR